MLHNQCQADMEFDPIGLSTFERAIFSLVSESESCQPEEYIKPRIVTMMSPIPMSPIPTNMSEDLPAIHAQTSAILEKLYDQKGQPEELDASFTHEFFKLVSEQVKVDDEAEEEAPRGPRTTDAKLSHPDKGLIEVNVPSKSEKFVVSNLKSGE